MFIVESKTQLAARKWSFLMFVALLVFKAFGGILTMHFYVNPEITRTAWLPLSRLP